MMVPHATIPAPTAKNSGYVTGWTHLKPRFPALDIASVLHSASKLSPTSRLTSVPLWRSPKLRQSPAQLKWSQVSSKRRLFSVSKRCVEEGVWCTWAIGGHRRTHWRPKRAGRKHLLAWLRRLTSSTLCHSAGIKANGFPSTSSWAAHLPVSVCASSSCRVKPEDCLLDDFARCCWPPMKRCF